MRYPYNDVDSALIFAIRLVLTFSPCRMINHPISYTGVQMKCMYCTSSEKKLTRQDSINSCCVLKKEWDSFTKIFVRFQIVLFVRPIMCGKRYHKHHFVLCQISLKVHSPINLFLSSLLRKASANTSFVASFSSCIWVVRYEGVWYLFRVVLLPGDDGLLVPR